MFTHEWWVFMLIHCMTTYPLCGHLTINFMCVHSKTKGPNIELVRYPPLICKDFPLDLECSFENLAMQQQESEWSGALSSVNWGGLECSLRSNLSRKCSVGLSSGFVPLVHLFHLFMDLTLCTLLWRCKRFWAFYFYWKEILMLQHTKTLWAIACLQPCGKSIVSCVCERERERDGQVNQDGKPSQFNEK